MLKETPASVFRWVLALLVSICLFLLAIIEILWLSVLLPIAFSFPHPTYPGWFYLDFGRVPFEDIVFLVAHVLLVLFAISCIIADLNRNKSAFGGRMFQVAEWLLLAFCVMAAANVLIESYFTNLPLSVLDYILLGTLALCVLLLLFRKPIRKKTGLYTLPLLLCGGCFLVWTVLIVLRDGADCLQQPFFYWSLFLTALPLLMAASRRLSHIDPYAEFRKPKAALQDVPS